MFDRIMGVITLKAPVYRAIADDTAGTSQAAIVFVVVTVIEAFFKGLVQTNSSGTTEFSFLSGIINIFVGLIFGLIAWVFTAWVLSAVARALDGKTSTSEMLRVTGFVKVFGLIAVLNVLRFVPALACLATILSFAVGILSLVGYVIGVREAAEFTTGKAIITGIIAAIVNFVIVVLIGGLILGLILAAVSIVS